MIRRPVSVALVATAAIVAIISPAPAPPSPAPPPLFVAAAAGPGLTFTPLSGPPRPHDKPSHGQRGRLCQVEGRRPDPLDQRADGKAADKYQRRREDNVRTTVGRR